MASKEIILVQGEQQCNELLPLQSQPPGFDFTDFRRRRNREAGQIIRNPDWLPSGWITEIRIRKSGNSAGHMDKYYFEPVNGERFRSKAEVQRYLETGSKEKPKGISNEQAQPDHAASACPKQLYYYLPVLCTSAFYSKHPGLYPVVYFPVIGNPEDRSKYPPLEFLQNLGHLKPFFPDHNVPSTSTSQNDLSRDSTVGSRRMNFKANARRKFSEDVSGGSDAQRKKPMLVYGLASQNGIDINRASSSNEVQQSPSSTYPASNQGGPYSSTMSCNISGFTVSTSAGVVSTHVEYRPSEQQHKSPITSQIQNQANQVRAMRGQLSPAEVKIYEQAKKISTCTQLSTCTDLVPWKPWKP
ncbi:hypothetical protein SUGI_0551930 [Cryptomeria japonica]|uniref:uncharacterized protein LOC131032012 n=1 Tax=Cryptomeria japonica TaxID=3369 RepID=UPI002408D026|nr:uncharacterized protein LOC131032012 [Cryptomeria japonica]GLJ28100.1 hypothetical protein SUGI_0551930 [Cryptomeria japonica]